MLWRHTGDKIIVHIPTTSLVMAATRSHYRYADMLLHERWRHHKTSCQSAPESRAVCHVTRKYQDRMARRMLVGDENIRRVIGLSRCHMSRRLLFVVIVIGAEMSSHYASSMFAKKMAFISTRHGDVAIPALITITAIRVLLPRRSTFVIHYYLAVGTSINTLSLPRIIMEHEYTNIRQYTDHDIYIRATLRNGDGIDGEAR